MAITKKKKAKSQKPEQKLWNLYETGVSPSAISDFLRCRQSFVLRYVEGWRSRTQPDYMLFGNLVHDMTAEALRVGRPLGFHEMKPFEDEARKDFRTNNPASTPQRRDDLELTIAQAHTVLNEYWEFWSDDFKYEWSIIEQPLRYDQKVYESHVVPVVGTLDGVYWKAPDQLWIIDTKCKSSFNENELMETFLCAIQFMTYPWLISKINPDLVTSGISMNVVKRPQIKLTAKDGNIKNHCERLASIIREDPESYFFRVEGHLTQRDIDTFERYTLMPILREIVRWNNHELETYTNPDALIWNHTKSEFYHLLTKGKTDGLVQGGCHWEKYCGLTQTSKATLEIKQPDKKRRSRTI